MRTTFARQGGRFCILDGDDFFFQLDFQLAEDWTIDPRPRRIKAGFKTDLLCQRRQCGLKQVSGRRAKGAIRAFSGNKNAAVDFLAVQQVGHMGFDSRCIAHCRKAIKRADPPVTVGVTDLRGCP